MKEAEKEVYEPIDEHTDKQTDRQTERQAERQAVRQVLVVSVSDTIKYYSRVVRLISKQLQIPSHSCPLSTVLK